MAGFAQSQFGLVRVGRRGKLDATFGNNGKVVTSYGEIDTNGASDVALQRNGKIVTVGSVFNLATGSSDFAVTRYTASGRLDESFGPNGRRLTSFTPSPGEGTGGSWDEANSVAITPDGGIAVAGTTNAKNQLRDMGVVMYRPNGSLNTSFAGDGKAVTDFMGLSEVGQSILVQRDGKVLVGGLINGPGTAGGYFGVARFRRPR
jgi:uncharacterized delta-60 repeat protein